MATSFHISILNQVEDSKDDSIDVFIRFENGEEYVASFFTVKNIAKLISKNRISGEQLGGLYFWASDMIIIEEINKENVRLVIEDLIKSGSFYQAVSAANDIAREHIARETKLYKIGEVLNPPIQIQSEKFSPPKK